MVHTCISKAVLVIGTFLQNHAAQVMGHGSQNKWVETAVIM